MPIKKNSNEITKKFDKQKTIESAIMKKRKKTDANNYSLEKMGILNLNETNKSPNTINSFPQTDEAIKRKSDAECLDNTNEKKLHHPNRQADANVQSF